MKRIYEKDKVAACIAKSKYHDVLESLDIDFYLIQYEKGELASSPFQKEFYSHLNTTIPTIATAIPTTFRHSKGCFSTPNHPSSSIT